MPGEMHRPPLVERVSLSTFVRSVSSSLSKAMLEEEGEREEEVKGREGGYNFDSLSKLEAEAPSCPMLPASLNMHIKLLQSQKERPKLRWSGV